MHIHFQATYLPNHKEFNVTVRWEGKRLFEKMTIARFLRFARQTDKPLIVDDVTITVDDEKTKLAIRDYFRRVAESYVSMKYRNN